MLTCRSSRLRPVGYISLWTLDSARLLACAGLHDARVVGSCVQTAV